MIRVNRTNNRKKPFQRLALLGFVIILAACGQVELTPVEVNPEDMCSMCRMAISEKQFAAEFITNDGDPFKFDDIGCLREYLKTRADRGKIGAYFVVDYETRKWIKAEEAYFVKSDQLTTPMGGNTVAFLDRVKADEARSKYQGQLLSWPELNGK